MKKRLGELLVAEGYVDQQVIDDVLLEQESGSPLRIGDALLARGAISPAQLAMVLSQQHEVPYIEYLRLDREATQLLPLEFQRSHRFAAFKIEIDKKGKVIHLAMADPGQSDIVEEAARRIPGARFVISVAPADDIQRALSLLSQGPEKTPAPTKRSTASETHGLVRATPMPPQNEGLRGAVLPPRGVQTAQIRPVPKDVIAMNTDEALRAAEPEFSKGLPRWLVDESAQSTNDTKETLHALIDLLIDKGILTPSEIERRLKTSLWSHSR